MQRYFIEETIQQIGESLVMSKDQAHHIQKVLRMTIGQAIEVVDAQERLYEAVLTDLSPVTITIERWIDQHVELPVKVTIYVGLSKGEKLEWIVQKATEMGAHTIVPIELKRNMVKWTHDKAPKKVERLRKIAMEAAEQSHRLHVPKVTGLQTLESAIEQARKHTQALVAYEEVAKEGEADQLVVSLQSLKAGDTLALFFGPEGGFEESEVEKMMLGGILPCALGPRILRAETAPLYALTAVSYQCELLAN